VDQTEEVEISYSDRSQAPATVTGIDEISGIALLRVSGIIPDHSTPQPGSLPHVGDWVFLVTTSFEDIAGYCPGIVRAVRPAGLNGQVTTEIEASASPLPASAGAVLINIHGDIVGLVVGRTGSDRTRSPNEPPSVPGILAVPLNEVLDISSKLAQSGHVSRGWIGLSVQEMTPALRTILGVDPGNGAIVVHIEENSPAFNAGLELGDVILTCQGKSIHSPSDVMGAVADVSPGLSIEFGILRNDEVIVLPLQPAPLSTSNPAVFEKDGKTRGTQSRIESLERELKRLKESLQ
jgi:serine protease Do